MSALLWEDSAVSLFLAGSRMLVCQMQLHGLNQVLTLTMDFDSVRDMKFSEAESNLFGMK